MARTTIREKRSKTVTHYHDDIVNPDYAPLSGQSPTLPRGRVHVHARLNLDSLVATIVAAVEAATGQTPAVRHCPDDGRLIFTHCLNMEEAGDFVRSLSRVPGLTNIQMEEV